MTHVTGWLADTNAPGLVGILLVVLLHEASQGNARSAKHLKFWGLTQAGSDS